MTARSRSSPTTPARSTIARWSCRLCGGTTKRWRASSARSPCSRISSMRSPIAGSPCTRCGRFEEALASYDRALALQPGSLIALCNRGNTLRAMQRLDEALASYDRAIALLPNFAEAHANRAILLAELKRYDEALAAFERQLTLQPNNAEAYNNRGVVLGEMKRNAEALANYDRAVSLSPDYTDAIYNRGNALHELRRFSEALACYDRVLASRPDDGNAFNNRGKVLKELNRYDEALACSARALAVLPDNIVAHCNEASMRLLIGDLPRGFAEYEWRWKKADMAPAKREFPQPLWLGAGDIAGKTILLHSEQGFGDAIQFCRYATLIAARGARVILEVRPALAALMASLAGPSAVIAKGDPLPDFDLHCPLLSLPLAMGTRLETIPAQVPYLSVSPELSAEWGARLGSQKRGRASGSAGRAMLRMNATATARCGLPIICRCSISMRPSSACTRRCARTMRRCWRRVRTFCISAMR